MEEKKEEKVVKSKRKTKKKSLPTKTYTLINRVKISGQWKEIGDKVQLTEEGRVYLKSIHKIK